MASVYIDDVEITVAVNKIKSRALFLIEAMESYVEILTALKEDGIQDVLISNALTDIQISANTQAGRIDEKATRLVEVVSEYVQAIEDIDNYQFTTEMVSSIESIVYDMFN